MAGQERLSWLEIRGSMPLTRRITLEKKALWPAEKLWFAERESCQKTGKSQSHHTLSKATAYHALRGPQD